MAAIEPDGEGSREKTVIDNENYYLVTTIGDDGWIHFMSKGPYENRPENHKMRVALDTAAKVWGAQVNAQLGNVGRSK